MQGDLEAEKAEKTRRSTLTYRSAWPEDEELVAEVLGGEVTITLRALARIRGTDDPFPYSKEGEYVTRIRIGDLHSLLAKNDWRLEKSDHRWV